ncbi:hypothetical protein MMC34_008066 [Xylographa carneopallida]|nr:hypothetical protein [Xylographa carneopallida]
MSVTLQSSIANPDRTDASIETLGQGQPARKPVHKNYNGFVAGVFSGIAKLSVGHPFDTIKVRLQTTDRTQFKGPLDCLLQTVRNEGVRGLYKGATPPLVGWMFMDSIMLGSLTYYRRLLLENVFTKENVHRYQPSVIWDAKSSMQQPTHRLPTTGHAIAGLMAGFTVSFIAAPIEHVKARLQIQYAADKHQRLYSGPIDCTKKIVSHTYSHKTTLPTLPQPSQTDNPSPSQLRAHGLPGLYHGLTSTLIFRSFFLVWWGSYDLLSRALSTHTALSTPAINFWAGGLSAQLFWIASYPSDVVKQRVMTDPLGGTLGDGERCFRGWRDAARAVWRRDGARGFWRGFVPCFLRAFPANAVALVAFEGVMRGLEGR